MFGVSAIKARSARGPYVAEAVAAFLGPTELSQAETRIASFGKLRRRFALVSLIICIQPRTQRDSLSPASSYATAATACVCKSSDKHESDCQNYG